MPRKVTKYFPIVDSNYFNPKLKEGDKFNNLTAVKYLHHRKTSKSTHSCWLFKCDCGNYVEYKDYIVRSNKATTCNNNCLLKRQGDNNAFEKVYRTYKWNAIKRKLIFDLTKEDFKKIAETNCFYCNIIPYNVCKERTNIYIYSGIDRVNNKLGYTINNCKPCCKNCNIAKNNMTISEFKNWINRIIANSHNLLNL